MIDAPTAFLPGDRAVCTINGRSDNVTIVGWEREEQCYLVESVDDPTVQGLAGEGELRMVGST